MPIDTDHATCPFCDARDPLRHLRVRRHALRVLALAAAVLVVTAIVAG